ncbi:MAG TPA: hypothetical protein VMI06_17470, partial [Terriglobia bacterium]|nr:hypothetical protein [Terriglobia bacterium]
MELVPASDSFRAPAFVRLRPDRPVSVVFLRKCHAARFAQVILKLASLPGGRTVIPEYRTEFNQRYSPEKYRLLLDSLEDETGSRVEFRVAETPVFLPESLLDEMADEGRWLT